MFIDLVVGARPNFVKIAPIIHALKPHKTFQLRLIHTGQHQDLVMSESFFKDLAIPNPDINLGVNTGVEDEKTAQIMVAYQGILQIEKPDLCLVVGDTNSAMACALVAKKQGIKLAHVEAGLRSFDNAMPEEINRKVIDAISDYFYTTSDFANQNLLQNGIDPSRIIFVGNTMIDSLLRNMPYFYPPDIYATEQLQAGKYLVLTLHRPSNVDKVNTLKQLLFDIVENSRESPIIFPIHPRTRQRLNFELPKNIIPCPPLPYLAFNYLVKAGKAVLTDSGGIQEESTVFGVPCLTLRHNTERPETIHSGTNELIGTTKTSISYWLNRLFENKWKKATIPPLWDGRASERIVRHLLTI